MKMLDLSQDIDNLIESLTRHNYGVARLEAEHILTVIRKAAPLTYTHTLQSLMNFPEDYTSDSLEILKQLQTWVDKAEHVDVTIQLTRKTRVLKCYWDSLAEECQEDAALDYMLDILEQCCPGIDVKFK